MQTTIRAVLVVLIGVTSASGAAREYGGQFTAERLKNLRANCERYDWGRQIRKKAIAAAAPWVAKSDEELWAMVPGQDLPRTIDTTLDRTVKGGPLRLGCLKCGDKINRFGNYPYEPDFTHKPWKLTCPSCGAVFPTNDFGKYYASGIDERGVFDPKKADRSLLYNTEHPDPHDPLHTYGVDDGFGYIDANGRGHRFVAYYAWKYWAYIEGGISALASAYEYTGDPRYAHKAAVLLDRIADVYPDMDWKPYADRGFYHSDGNTGEGKVQGRIWETSDARNLADNYDRILSGTVGDEALFAFLKRQSEKYKTPLPKGTRDLFVANVDERILREIFRSVLAGKIEGNEGMHQMSVTAAAMALDTEPETTQWLDWLFAPNGGAIPGLIVSRFDRDGFAPEGAPGYALLWGGSLSDLAFRLAEYPKYTKHDILKDFPQFRAYFTAAYCMAALGVATPNLGDTGSTGSVGRVAVNPAVMAMGYRFTKDPEIAVATYRANNNSAVGLVRDLSLADPEALANEIESVAKSAGPRPSGSSLMTGFGLATVETGTGDNAMALCCNYGRTLYHAHKDQLNFDLFACGHWLAPDLGYPEFATAMPSRSEWNNNTISHNTVTVDGATQVENYGGHTRFFKSLPGFNAFEIEAPGAYPKIKEYARTMLTIDAPGGRAYVVDLFRVVGGKDHLYSFHGPPGEVSVESLSVVPQSGGTYAGTGVNFGGWAKGFPPGYQFLYDVRRDAQPPDSFTVDWHADPGYRDLKRDDVHVRLHALTECADVALANGDPPQNKAGNPRRLTYALLHRTGEKSLESTFVSVIEPYRGMPFIKSVNRISPAEEGRAAIRVELADGTTDTILYNAGSGPMQAGTGISMDGRVGFIRESGGRVARAVVVEGSSLNAGGIHLESRPALTGKVVRMNKELDGGGVIWVDAALPSDGSLVGQQLVVRNDNERDACYTIRSVSKDGDLTKVDCGPISFVRSYAGPTMKLRGQSVPKDYAHGYVYDFKEGDGFAIPMHADWTPLAGR